MIVVSIDALFLNSLGLFLKLKEDLWCLLQIEIITTMRDYQWFDMLMKV